MTAPLRWSWGRRVRRAHRSVVHGAHGPPYAVSSPAPYPWPLGIELGAVAVGEVELVAHPGHVVAVALERGADPFQAQQGADLDRRAAVGHPAGGEEASRPAQPQN